MSLRVGVYQKRLDGLVASVPLGLNPDSTIFGNADAGTTRGVEILAERELRNGYGFRVAYTLQDAKATSTDPFLLNRLIVVDPSRRATRTGPRGPSSRSTSTSATRSRSSCAARRPARSGPRSWACGRSAGSRARSSCARSRACPFSRVDTLTTDSLVGLPNGSRLPGTSTMDLLVRRPLRLGGTTGGIYLDVRNLLNRRNVVAVRRDTGRAAGRRPMRSTGWRKLAYTAHPETIPYESSRYRRERRLERRRLPVGPGGAVPALPRGGA